ncbi:MAG: hypothetical protein ACFFC7_15795 [Candidatus Hermodarchaeota archaeon]
MKKKNIWLLGSVLGLLLILNSGLTNAQTGLADGDKFTFSLSEKVQFRDHLDNHNQVEIQSTTSFTVTELNSTHVNTTSVYTQNYGYVYWFVQNGGWTMSKIDGEAVYSSHQEINRTFDPNFEYIRFYWQEYPKWNNATAGREFRYWNTSYYYERFNYFDSTNDDTLDVFYFQLYLPTFTNNLTLLINTLKKQWNALAYGKNVNQLPKFRWNVSEQSWYSFNDKLFSNMAYSASVIKNDSFDNAEIVEFTPAWVGDYWFPDSFERWNGIYWVPRVPIDSENYAFSSNPISWTGQLRSDITYYARSTLNQRRDPINDTFETITTNFDVSSFTISLNAPYEDRPRLTYHASHAWNNGGRNEGNLSLTYNAAYDSQKGVLSSYTDQIIYDFGKNGFFQQEIRYGGPIATPGFETAIVLIIGVVGAIIIGFRRKKKCL